MKTLGYRNSFKDRKKTHASRTPGKQKAPCQITYLDKFFARKSRSYKHKDYAIWCEKSRKKNSMSAMGGR